MHALLRAGAQLTVVNVFTRSDYAVDTRTIHSALPFVDAVSQARLTEDENFVADLLRLGGQAQPIVALHDLDLLDAPLRLIVKTEQVLESPLTDAEVSEQAKALAEHFAEFRTFDLVFAPLALGDHIDHRIVREAAKLCILQGQLCFYEDLPYAARMSSTERDQAAACAVASNKAAHFRRYALHMPHGPHLKKRLAMHYPSQIALEVADEMADYAAQWSSGDAGAERWWAEKMAGALVAGLLQYASVPCSVVEEQR